MPAPYADEDDLWNGLFNSTIGWTWPLQVTLPLLDDLLQGLFIVPLGPVLPHWTQPVIDKWNQFINGVHSWFTLRENDTVEDAEALFALLLEACESVAADMEFDIWDELEGLPSMPVYDDDTTGLG